MIEKWDITIPELTGDEVRSAYICLPETYTFDTNQRFPVLYMFDGHNLFFTLMPPTEILGTERIYGIHPYPADHRWHRMQPQPGSRTVAGIFPL